jgi:hypothetical protein
MSHASASSAPPPERSAVQHRERRHREQAHGVQRRHRIGHESLGRLLVAHAGQVGEVGAGAERVLARAAEHGQAQVVQRGVCVEHRFELAQHLARQGVAFRRPVERDAKAAALVGA